MAEHKITGGCFGHTQPHNLVKIFFHNFSTRRVAAISDEYRQKLGLRTLSVHERVNTLSGGNQQKTLLARWLLTDPDVLIVDESTHSIEVGSNAEIYALLRQLARQGKVILLISSELPELRLLSDRILVVRDGRVSAELNRAEATEELIMHFVTT